MVFLIALGALVATLTGGLFALRFRDKLHLILGFSAGAVIGVAFFDLLPESIDLAHQTYQIPGITSVVALGFALFLILDRFITLHVHTHEHDESSHQTAQDSGHAHQRGRLGAISLSIHSFLDGAGIGLAFKVSPAIGLIVAAAVLAHDFSDGINTVSLILKNNGSRKEALRWLATDALAPAVGVAVVQAVILPEDQLGLLLALFCGFFLYIGASDLLPESHHNHPTFYTTLSTLAGMLVLYFAVRFASL